jgi:hypothetical protein
MVRETREPDTLSQDPNGVGEQLSSALPYQPVKRAVVHVALKEEATEEPVKAQDEREDAGAGLEHLKVEQHRGG